MTWIAGNTDFPIDHLPYGVVQPANSQPRLGVAVGTNVLDLAACVRAGAVSAIDESVASAPSLNPLIDLGPEAWAALRSQLLELVRSPNGPRGATDLLHPVENVELLLPIDVADYVDFYSSLEHATNLGRFFRPDGDPLLPNWRHVPIGYHGRAGTVVASGQSIVRPRGQRKSPDEVAPTFGPSARLDIELELGAVLSRQRHPGDLTVQEAHEHIFGLVLLNDWSARDIQSWEYQPLGPFLGKSFATTISPWVVPMASAERFLALAPVQDPPPLPYLRDDRRRNFNIHLEIEVRPHDSVTSTIVSTTNSSSIYWTFGQQIAHMVSNGATLRTGDLIGTGTISGEHPGSEGSFIELSKNGSDPFRVGEAARTFLEDGDTVALRGRLGDSNGPSFGDCAGTIWPARGA